MVTVVVDKGSGKTNVDASSEPSFRCVEGISWFSMVVEAMTCHSTSKWIDLLTQALYLLVWHFKTR
jgi:hypothetical protein